MIDLMETIVKAIVDNPNDVVIKEVEGVTTSIIELHVAKEDLGKVIGKQGRIAQAIRIILIAASARFKKKFVLEIVEED